MRRRQAASLIERVKNESSSVAVTLEGWELRPTTVIPLLLQQSICERSQLCGVGVGPVEPQNLERPLFSGAGVITTQPAGGMCDPLLETILHGGRGVELECSEGQRG